MRQARDKFRQAISLQTGGDWAGALSLLREVAAVKTTPQVRFNVALCEENLGQLVAARGSYQLAIAEAEGEGAESVVDEARQRLDSLEGRIPKVVIERGEGAELARISLDGVVVGATLVGKAMPVDPGPHVVEASARGFSTFREAFRVTEKEEKFVRLTLTPLTPEAERAQVSRALPDAPSAEQRSRQRSVWPWILGGAGAASLAASGVFFVLRADAISELDEQCGPSGDACPASAQATIDRGQTYTTLGNLTLAGGVVLAGAALTWWLVESPSQVGVGLRPITPSSAALVGTF